MNETFNYNNQVYEIRCEPIACGYSIQAFSKNRAVSCVYTVSSDVESDYQHQHNESAIVGLKELVKQDVIRGLFSEE